MRAEHVACKSGRCGPPASLSFAVGQNKDSMRRTTERKQPTLSASVSSIREYADSFEGLPIGKIRRRLAAGKITHKKWEHGKQLVATFPKYEVRVFLFAGKAVMTSVQILSK